MKIRINIVFISLFFLLSCATSVKEIDFRNREFTIEEFNKEVSKVSGELKTLTGTGIIHFATTESFEKVNAEICINFPDSVFIKLEGPFGVDVAYIFVNKDELKYYNIRDKVKYEGEYSDENFKKLTRTRLEFVEIMELFGAKLNLNIINSNNSIKILERGNEYILRIKTDDGFEAYFIDRKIWQIKKYLKIDKKEQVVLEKRFEEYRRIQNFFIPKVVKYIIPDEQQITLIYKKLKINDKINPSKFYINIPEDVDEIIL